MLVTLCQKLIVHYSFIRLADYLIVNTMHVLAVNSVSTLLNYLSEQLQNTPSLADIQGWNKAIEEMDTTDIREKTKSPVKKEEDVCCTMIALFH